MTTKANNTVEEKRAVSRGTQDHPQDAGRPPHLGIKRMHKINKYLDLIFLTFYFQFVQPQCRCELHKLVCVRVPLYAYVVDSVLCLASSILSWNKVWTSVRQSSLFALRRN